MEGKDTRGIDNILRPFRSRNYLLFYVGQGISLIGTWMQRIAMSWLVYRLTGSALLLGVVGFVNQLPTFILAPFAGVMADRWNRHRALVVTQAVAMAQAMVLAFLVLSGSVNIWHILVLGGLLGVVNAFDVPIRQSFVIDMVTDREVLGSAIALNSSLFNAARMIGPSVAGIMIAAFGEGLCFLLNALSYIAVIGALMAMKFDGARTIRLHKSLCADMREGASYAWNERPIRWILLLLALVSLIGVPYTVLMPVFATEVLHGGPHTLGFLMAASGAGALIGAFFLASRPSARGLGLWISMGAICFGAGLVGFALARSVSLAITLLVVTGFGMIVQTASSNTVLQTIVDEDKRGRIMSFYTMALMGMAPFGNLMAGTLAQRMGAVTTVLLGGVACILAGSAFAMQRRRSHGIRAPHSN